MRRRLITLACCVSLVAGLIAGAPSGAAPEAASGPRFDPHLGSLLLANAPSILTIVVYRSTPGLAQADRLTKLGFRGPYTRFRAVPALSATGPASAVKRLASDATVRYVALVRSVPLSMDRARDAGRVDGVRDVHYRSNGVIRRGGFTGKGVRIAILDSGVDATHPDLIHKDLAALTGAQPKTVLNLITATVPGVSGEVVDSLKGVHDAPTSSLVESHGTHVAGIAAGTGGASDGKYGGVATGAELIGISALDPDNGFVDLYRLLVGLDWLHANHKAQNIRIVNSSWGGLAGTGSIPDPDHPITIGIRKLVDEGLVMVFAAGNDGGDGATATTGPEANIDGVINVANYDDITGTLETSSSRGAAGDPRTWPDVAAPGTTITSTIAMNATGMAYATGLTGGPHAGTIFVNAPLPTATETSVAGIAVGVGRYGTLTGTSMASPFVAGVAALLLEANPGLTASQVREIIRGTASMPVNRSRQRDEFAFGTGMVNAARAIAAALRVKDGATAAKAIETATVNYETSPWTLNVQPPRSLSIAAPATIKDHKRKPVDITTTYTPGDMPDTTIPGAPALIGGTARMYQRPTYNAPVGNTVGVDPFFGQPTAFQGTHVSFQGRNLTSAVVDFATATARHVITRDGQVVYGPFDAEIDITPGEVSTSSEWDVPTEATPGDYTFEVKIGFAGHTYDGPTASFTIDTLPPSALLVASTGATRATGAPLFTETFEAGADGWTTDNHGTATGALTDWTLIGADAILTYNGSHEGTGHYYVGHAPGATTVSGAYYEDLADARLLSPVIDLSAAAAAEVAFWLSGASEDTFDFLHVGVVDAATPDAEPEVFASFTGGDHVDWAQHSFFAPGGRQLRLVFQFVSDEPFDPTTNVIAGWNIDDVSVTPASAGPAFAALGALRAEGFRTLDTTFLVSASGAFDSFTLDFGDGTPAAAGSEPAAVQHVYSSPGTYIATLTVSNAQGTTSDTVLIDVIPEWVVQLRTGTGAWQVLGPALSEPRTFTTSVQPNSLPLGPVRFAARHCEREDRCITTSGTSLVG